MNTLTVKLRTVTPLFLGGARPDESAELRPPSVKGLLRFWYRAANLDLGYRKHEARIFGGTGANEGQSLFRLRCGSPVTGTMEFDSARYRNAPFQIQGKKGILPKNGLVYLGFPFGMLGGERRAIPPGEVLSFTNRFSVDPDPQTRRAVLAAWWLLGHCGGLGSRARRGFGTVALEEWKCGWSEADSLPLAHGAGTPDEWIQKVETAFRTIRTWFPDHPLVADRTTISPGSRIVLYSNGLEDNQFGKAWEWALWRLGMDMQGFRQLRAPDYDRVKAHLVQRGILAAQKKGQSPPPTPTGVAPRFLGRQETPERAAFGLPLAFRYRSLQRTGFPYSTTFVPNAHDRWASPIFLRVVQIGDRVHPMLVKLNGPTPGQGMGITEQKGRSNLDSPSAQILDDFFAEIRSTQATLEVQP